MQTVCEKWERLSQSAFVRGFIDDEGLPIRRFMA